MEGVVRAPSAFSITRGWLPSMMATQELVVPRSIPMTLAMGAARRDPTTSLWLTSGDVVVMGGAARLAFHGVDRIRFGSSTLLPPGGRLNLTLRVVAGG
jgi:hypothetical protein